MNLQVWIAIGVGLAATIEDLLRRQISNWIPIAALIGGVLFQMSVQGWKGLLTALLGTVAGFGVFLVFYLLGGMGGGDVKLMAGFGALLGAGRLFEAALWTAGCGGLLAMAVLAVSYLKRLRAAPNSTAAPVKAIPYAPAITLGVWLSLVPKG